MAIQGSLETFSLPELCQIIESGYKTGRLTFNPGLKNKNSDLKQTFELWFDKGNFITIINSLKHQFLLTEIQDNNWLDTQSLVSIKSSCPQNLAFGAYLQKQNILSSLQIDSLFEGQIYESIKLFNIDHAKFKFEEVDNQGIITSDGKAFPWREMTGRQKKATELSLTAMRNFSNWSRFAADMPTDDCGLQKLVTSHDLQLSSLEEYLWQTANGSTSLKIIAQKMGISKEKVQQTALSMIFVGLVEEVPITDRPMDIDTAVLTKQSTFIEQSNVAIKTRNKVKVSNSLINNLVSFLRNNF
jgi:hypothetical protein